MAAGAFAGQRTRDAQTVRSSSDPVAIGEVEPDGELLQVDGLTIRPSGFISLEEVESAYGSAGRYAGQLKMADAPSRVTPDGSTIYLSGFVGYFEDLLGSQDFPTLESYMETADWKHKDFGGVEVIYFPSGMVTAKSDPRVQTNERPGGLDTGSGIIYASGSLHHEE